MRETLRNSKPWKDDDDDDDDDDDGDDDDDDADDDDDVCYYYYYYYYSYVVYHSSYDDDLAQHHPKLRSIFNLQKCKAPKNQLWSQLIQLYTLNVYININITLKT